MKVFISYAHDDNEPIVMRIRHDLGQSGHDVWIDVAKIKAGDDWRRSITDGIRDSQAVLAFLSRHSVRDPGVCRDELAIALGALHGSLQTVLLEDEDSVCAPVSLAHIQWVDMSDWRSRADGEAGAYEAWYRDCLEQISTGLEKLLHFRRDTDWLRERLLPRSPAIRIGELLRNGFVGRAWLLAEIEQWRQRERQRRVLCITGEPGIGKSAIAAWLAHNNSAYVIAAHFCQYDDSDSCNPRRVVDSIAFQMAMRQHDFCGELRRTIERLEAQKPEAGKLAIKSLKDAEYFMALLATPAKLCIHGGRERYIVVIDGLDEAGDELTEFLARHHRDLPDWLGFVVTSRPSESGIYQHLRALFPRELAADEIRNRDDARAYAEHWLKLRPELDRGRRRKLADAFASASGGNFLYLSKFRELVEAGQLELDDSDAAATFPQGLESLYLSYFKRLFPDQQRYQQWQAPLLRLIAASTAPVPIRVAQYLMQLDEEQLWDKVLRPLGSLFRITQDDNPAVSAFHASVREWLQGRHKSGPYFVSCSLGRRRLALLLWVELIRSQRDPGRISAYTAEQLPVQLLAGGLEIQQEVLTNPEAWKMLRPVTVTLAEMADSMGRGSTAIAWRRVIALFDNRLLDEADTGIADNLNALGVLLGDGGEWQEAEQLFRHSLKLVTRHQGPQSAAAAGALNYVGMALQNQDRLQDARALFDQALRINRELPAPDQRHTAAYLHNWALTNLEADPAAAEPLLREALQLALAQHGEDHPITVTCLGSLAKARGLQHDAAEAGQLLTRALSLARRPGVAPYIDPESLSYLMLQLARADVERGASDSAVAHFREALAVREERFGAHDLESAVLKHEFACLQIRRQDLDHAIGLLQEALPVLRSTYGDEAESVAEGMKLLAATLLNRQRVGEARAVLEELVKIRTQHFGSESSQTASALMELAYTLSVAGQSDVGNALFDRAWALYVPLLRAAEPLSDEARAALIRVLEFAGQADGARSLLQNQLQLLRLKEGAASQRVLACARELQAIIDRHSGEAADPASR